MILLIDNYDSFSYNLYQMIGEITPDIRVVRNDELSCQEIEQLAPSHIVLSPGPGRPEDAGICQEAALYFAGKIPVLGVCLGHQAICQAFGGKVGYAKRLMHGKQSAVSYQGDAPIFGGLSEQLLVARYHSLAAHEETMPEVLEVIARSIDDNEIMAVKHKNAQVYGLQFHPESILTPEGRIILQNFIQIKED